MALIAKEKGVGVWDLKGKGLKGKLPDRVELEIGFLTEKVEDRDLQRGKDGGGHYGPSSGGG